MCINVSEQTTKSKPEPDIIAFDKNKNPVYIECKKRLGVEYRKFICEYVEDHYERNYCDYLNNLIKIYKCPRFATENKDMSLNFPSIPDDEAMQLIRYNTKYVITEENNFKRIYRLSDDDPLELKCNRLNSVWRLKFFYKNH